MPGRDDDVLPRAIRAVSVLRVAEALGINDLKMGMNMSPFRDERTGSFSIFGDGHRSRFKDHGTAESGGCWKFVELARPDWESKEVAEFLIELAGMSAENRARKKSPAELRRERAEERRANFRKRRDVYKLDRIEACPAWSRLIRERFEEGCFHLLDEDNGVAARLAGERGWPIEWVIELATIGKLSVCPEPWGNKRQAAFLIEQPELDLRSKGMRLSPVGYHQRFFDARAGKKKFLFVPWKPRKNGSTEFYRHLSEINRSVHPYPFVMGDTSRADVVVILEGQWDAITFWGALGLFDYEASGPGGANVVVFGLRGAASEKIFIGRWGAWLQAHGPAVWCLIDNDEAGQKWRGRSDSGNPNLVARLRHLGLERVVVSWFGQVNDFNDAFRADPAGLTPEKIYQSMKSLKLLK